MIAQPGHINPIVPILLAIALALLWSAPELRAQDTVPPLSPEPPGSSEGPGVFSLKAHFKDLAAWYRADPYSETMREKCLAANMGRIRLSPGINLSDTLIIHVDYDNELTMGNHLGSPEFDRLWRSPGADYNDLLDLSNEVEYTDDYLYVTKVHRAYVKLVLDDFTLTAGRQQIRFGSGRLWNPLDIMNPVSPLSIEGAEEQKGADALRADYFFNEYTVLTAVADQRRVDNDGRFSSLSAENTSALGRFKTTVWRADVALLGGRVLRRDVAGADLSVIVLDGTLRGSAIRSRPEDGAAYTQASAGFEYNFGFGLYFLVEYFYNERGLNYDREMRDAYLSRLALGVNEDNYYLLSNQFITFNRHYLGLALGYDITPLLRAELFAMCDFQGRALLANPTVKYNAFQDVDLTVGVMKTWAAEGADRDSDFEYLKEHPLWYATFTWYFL